MDTDNPLFTQSFFTQSFFTQSFDAPRRTVMLAGELDMYDSPGFLAACRALEPGPLTVDMTALYFMDSAGLAALLNVMRLCRESGQALKLIAAARSQPLRALTLLRLGDILDVEILDQEATL